MAVVHLETPSLAARREDVPLLAEHFLKSLADAVGFKYRLLTDEARAALQTYTWPGNVRQLRNVLERTLLLGGREADGAIGVEELPDEVVAVGA